MTTNEMRDTVRQMLNDWNQATPTQRNEALRQAVARADATEQRLLLTAANTRAGGLHV